MNKFARQEWQLDWVAHIFLRNVVATLAICGFWDWFLYFSPLAAKLHKYKINPVYPSMRQIRHDAGVTVSASCFAAMIEVILCHCWATGRLSLVTSLSEAPVTNLVMALLLTHYRSGTHLRSPAHCSVLMQDSAFPSHAPRHAPVEDI